MRVSIVNPRKKARKAKATKKKRFSKKARAAAMRNLKKARAARKKGRKGSHARKSRKKKKGKKSRKAKRMARKSRRKGRKGKKRKSRKARKSRRKSRKGKKRKHRKAKGMPRGRRVRPAMYVSRKSKRIRHSPKSRYARKGYRFNPSLKAIVPRQVQPHIIAMKGAKLDMPHVAGGVVGFVSSGYAGGYFRTMGARYSSNEVIQGGVSVLGNVVGTEVPAIVAHWVLGKAKKPGLATSVARGMRVGGYVALGLNVLSMGLKMVGVKLPFRALSEDSPASDLWLSGVGDWDLALSGLGDLIQGNEFDATESYASLGADEGLLDAEIAALSAYLGEDLDEFAGVTNDSGISP